MRAPERSLPFPAAAVSAVSEGTRIAWLSRAMIYVAAALLLVPFFQPLWYFDFDAPQYPEGLGMSIWIDRLGGRADLINELNHYIGMLPLDESFFPEFSFIPWVIALLFLWAVVAATTGRLRPLLGWVVTYALLGAAGVLEFYSRLYQFGHDLSPEAAIRVAPFTPRLIGTYHIMNFGVTAYPGVGAIALVLSFLLGAAALLLAWRTRRRSRLS